MKQITKTIVNMWYTFFKIIKLQFYYPFTVLLLALPRGLRIYNVTIQLHVFTSYKKTNYIFIITTTQVWFWHFNSDSHICFSIFSTRKISMRLPTGSRTRDLQISYIFLVFPNKKFPYRNRTWFIVDLKHSFCLPVVWRCFRCRFVFLLFCIDCCWSRCYPPRHPYFSSIPRSGCKIVNQYYTEV